MKLINFQGLTCYSNSIVSIANDFGIDYAPAFGCLWSEYDFYYQPDRSVYLSKRLPAALESLGLKLIMQLCDSPDQALELLSRIEEGESVIIGMDAFYVPWSQFYGFFHGSHFFIGRYAGGDTFFCFDPTFDKSYIQLSRSEIISHAYDISRMIPVAKKPFYADPLSGAREILHTHPEMQRRLLGQLERREKEGVALSAKYVDALLNNRYLYRHYTEHLPIPCKNTRLFMDDSFFSKWVAVKNGLYKALADKENEFILSQTRALLCQLIDAEIAMADRIIADAAEPEPQNL